MPTGADLEPQDFSALEKNFDEEIKGGGAHNLPIVDFPLDAHGEIQNDMKRSLIETSLVAQLEGEISNLLGSIKVQASSIKATL